MKEVPSYPASQSPLFDVRFLLLSNDFRCECLHDFLEKCLFCEFLFQPIVKDLGGWEKHHLPFLFHIIIWLWRWEVWVYDYFPSVFWDPKKGGLQGAVYLPRIPPLFSSFKFLVFHLLRLSFVFFRSSSQYLVSDRNLYAPACRTFGLATMCWF